MSHLQIGTSLFWWSNRLPWQRKCGLLMRAPPIETNLDICGMASKPKNPNYDLSFVLELALLPTKSTILKSPPKIDLEHEEHKYAALITVKQDQGDFSHEAHPQLSLLILTVVMPGLWRQRHRS